MVVTVTDINEDGADEFIVTGFGYPNLALKYESGKLINVVNESVFKILQDLRLALLLVI